MSKSRRKVTVDTAKSVSDDSEKRKPSVFERLGPGGGQRKYDYEAERMEKSSYVEKCRNWLLTGSCSFGSKCKFLHGPFTGGANAPEGRIRSSKRHESDNTDDIKLKLKSPRDKGNDRKQKNENSSTEKRSHSKIKHEKEGKIKSTVVVKKPVEPGSEIDSEEPEEWSEDDSLKNLDFKEELTLMRKRQKLQRELNNLPALPDEQQRENLTIEKKVRRHILPGEHSVRVSSSESGSIHSSPEPSKQQSKKSMKPIMNPSSKKKDKKKHKASKSPLNKNKNAPCPDQMPKEKEKKRQISEERDIHHKVRMKKKKHKESLSETDNKSPDVPEPVRGHKIHSPLFDIGSSKSKLPLSPKHDWQKELKPPWALEDGECYSVSSKKSRRSRSPSSGEKSRRKKSLSPALEKRSKHSPMNVLPPERDSVVEKITLRKSRARGITPPEKVPSLSTSKDRSLSSDDERSAHSSIHDGEKRKNKKGRFPDRMHVSRSKSGKGDDRLLYPETSESRQNEWRNESPPPRERRDRRNRDFTPERTLKASRSGSREHEKMERDSKLSKKKDGAKILEPCPESRGDRKRQFKEDRLLPVCSPELQEPNYTKPRRLLPDPPEPPINPSRRGLSPKDTFSSCHSRSPSRQRRGDGRDRSPFDVLQMRRKDIVSEDYRHDEQPPAESPGRNRLLPDNNYFPDNFDYSPGRQFIEHLNEDRRNERFMGYRSESRVESRYSQQTERYPFEDRRRYNEEPIPTVYEDRTHYDNSRNRTNRDLYERDRYDRVTQSSRSDPRYEEDSFSSCHLLSPSRERRGKDRDRSPFDELQKRRKDSLSDDYRYDEQSSPESPGRNRILHENKSLPDNFDLLPGQHPNKGRRNKCFDDYHSKRQVKSRYSQPTKEKRCYNEESIRTDSSRNQTNRDSHERDRYKRVSRSSKSDPRYEEAKDPLVYDRNLPPDYREPTTEVWENRGRGRGRVNPRSRGRQSENTGHRGRGYALPPEDRLPGIARDQFSGVAERPSRRSEWERHQEEYFGPDHVEWSDHRNERNLPTSHDDPRQELHDIPDLRRGRRPDSRDEWRNGRRDAEDLYERRTEINPGPLITPDRMEIRPDRWENRQPAEAPRRPDLHKNDNKHDDRIDKRNLSPGEKDRLDSRRKRPRDQDPEQSRSRSPSLKHHRENSPVDSFHSHSSLSDHRADGVGREWMPNRWPPPQPDPVGLRDKEGCGDGGQWAGIRQRSPLQKHLLDKKRNKEWENNRAAREKDLLDKDADRLKGKDRDKLKDQLESDNQLLYPDGQMLMNRKNRPKKKDKRKRSLSKSPSLDGKDRKRICRGMSPKGSSVHEDKEKLVQPPQQSQELTFSDWSDDEAADDILNRPEEPQEPVVPLIEPHIKEDRFKHSPGRGGFMNQPIRQMHNPKEDYRMWQPHKERNSRYHWEKPNLSTQPPRLPLVRTLLERHHKDMVPDMCFRMKPDHLSRLLPDPEPMSDLRPPMDSSNHGNVVDMMPVIKQPLLGDAPGCVPLHSMPNMPMPTPPINPMLLQNILSMPHNMGHPMPMNTLAPPMPPINPATFAVATAAAAVAAAAASSNTTTATSTATTTTTTTAATPTPTNVATPTTRPNSDINGLDLDSAGMQYEEISSEEESMEGELDLELLGVGGDKKKKKSIVDVLNIDWSHVMQTNRPKHSEKSGSALQRYWPRQIFSKIGVSRQFAGEELYQKLQDLCNKPSNEEKEKEKAPEGEEEEANNEGEESTKETITPAENKFQFKNDIAALHMAMVKKAKERANLLHDVGSHRRALCARKDLEIRRQLCQVDKSLEQTSIYPNQIIDSDLCKLSVQLFKQGNDNCLRKETPLLAKEVPCSS